ncbi:SRPBCC domain-containing protein [Streptomyces achromogenes]|uniref:SRPBCC domain-containing protein n=1 Tax=Streptomyces achromogenes TaxID=67255 RepID=UPI00055BA2C8|nr:SRPBCC domain-containing protein [Streptomyces achromogenes]
MGHHDRAPGFGYVTYLASTPEKVWEALTDAGLTAVCRGRRNVSDWWPGSRWEHVRADGSGVVDVVGRVVEGEPPARLVATWAEPGEEGRENRPFRVTFELRPYEDIVRPAVTPDDPADESERAAVAAGWPAVPSHLKTLLETGRPLPQKPWRVPAG